MKIAKTESKSVCLQCKLSGRKPGAAILYRDEHLTVSPYAKKLSPGFLVITPRRHVEDIDLLDAGEREKLFSAACAFSSLLKEKLGAERVYWTVFCESSRHVHLWILPRLPGMKNWGMRPGKTDHCHAHILLHNLFEGKCGGAKKDIDAAIAIIRKFAPRYMQKLRKRD